MTPRSLAALPAAVATLAIGAGCAKPAAFVPLPAACPVCRREEPPPERLYTEGLLPSRYLELNTFGTTQVTFTHTEPHFRAGVGFEVDLNPSRKSPLRFLAQTTTTWGGWGDQQHGLFMLENGVGAKLSLWPSNASILDPYLIATESLLVGVGGPIAAGSTRELGNLAGGGLGVRVIRSFSAELTVRWVHALGTPFTALRDGAPVPSVPGVGFSVGLDACAFTSACDYKPLKQTAEDATCAIYQDARGVCASLASDPGGRLALCQQAREALSITATPVLARAIFASFLDKLASRASAVPGARGLGALVDANQCLEGWKSCGRRQECLLAQEGATVASRRVYAPYALEVFTALGCDVDAAGTVILRPRCDYTCEDAATAVPKPAYCSAPAR